MYDMHSHIPSYEPPAFISSVSLGATGPPPSPGACEKSSMWQAAALLMSEAMAAAADVVAFNGTISACEKAGAWHMATGWLEELGTSEAD